MVKKRYIVLMIFVCLFAISTVSANEMMNETDSLMIDESNDLIIDNVESDNLMIGESNDLMANDIDEEKILQSDNLNSKQYFIYDVGCFSNNKVFQVLKNHTEIGVKINEKFDGEIEFIKSGTHYYLETIYSNKVKNVNQIEKVYSKDLDEGLYHIHIYDLSKEKTLGLVYFKVIYSSLEEIESLESGKHIITDFGKTNIYNIEKIGDDKISISSEGKGFFDIYYIDDNGNKIGYSEDYDAGTGIYNKIFNINDLSTGYYSIKFWRQNGRTYKQYGECYFNIGMKNYLKVNIYKLSEEYDGYNHVSLIKNFYIGDNAVNIERKTIDDEEYIVLTINKNFKGEAYIFDQSTNEEQIRFSIDNEKGKSINILIDNYESGDYALIINESTVSDTQTIAYSLFFIPYMSVAPDVTKYYGGNERFTATIKNEVGKIVPNANVDFVINGKVYTRTSNDQGIASIALNLNSGVYDIIASCKNQIINSKVTIKPTVQSEDFCKIYKNGTQYYATFVDSLGNLLKNTPVQLNINGVYYTRNTDNQGVAKMNINLNPGTYVLTAVNPASGEQHTTKITVLPNIVENYDLTKYYKSASQFTFRLLNDNGKPVGDGVSATININGVFYTRISDASGYVKMNINLNPGTYIATIQYNGLMMSNTVKVLSILKGNDISMKYRDGTKYEVQLLDSQGNPYSGEDVTFNINGVFYKRTTDDNGIARLNINLMADTYIITSEYNGLMMSNTIIVDPNPLYYTIGSNPLNYGYYMNKYNKFSLDWYYNPQWDAMVKTIYDIYGNQGMEIRDQDVRNDIKYHCYEASTGRQYILNSAGEVLPFY